MPPLTVGKEPLDKWGFQDYSQLQNYQYLQAEATPLDGFILRDDFGKTIGRYIRSSEDVRLWPLLKKERSEADLNREMTEGDDPQTGFVSKLDLSGTPSNPTDYNTRDLSDPGQQNKALGGRVQIGHYARSLWEQQNQPYSTQLAERTQKLISSTVKNLERALFWGDANTNPLEFNGLVQQMAPNHSFQADLTKGDDVSSKLRGIVRLSISDEKIIRGVTHILTSALGCELLENEANTKLEYTNVDEISPGLQVPGVITQRGRTPVIHSPFLRDTENENGYDWVHYYLIDADSMAWKGVIPQGGDNTFNPQIFDVRNYLGNNQYMIEERLCLMYGTLHCLNRGQGVWKLSVAVPLNTIGNI